MVNSLVDKAAAEFAAALRYNGLSPEDGFEAVDADADGRVRMDDLHAAVQKLDLEVSQVALEALYQEMDSAGSGFIEIAAWVRCLGERDVDAVLTSRGVSLPTLSNDGRPKQEGAERGTQGQRETKTGGAGAGTRAGQQHEDEVGNEIAAEVDHGAAAAFAMQGHVSVDRAEAQVQGCRDGQGGGGSRESEQGEDGDGRAGRSSEVREWWRRLGRGIKSAICEGGMQRRDWAAAAAAKAAWAARAARARVDETARAARARRRACGHSMGQAARVWQDVAGAERGGGVGEEQGHREAGGVRGRDDRSRVEALRAAAGGGSSSIALPEQGAGRRGGEVEGRETEVGKLVEAGRKGAMVGGMLLQAGVREVREHKMSACLAFAAILLAVVIVATVGTLYDYTPLIMLSMVEHQVGQMDARVSPGEWTNHEMLDYAKMRAAIHAFRISSHIPSPPPSSSGGRASSEREEEAWTMLNFSAPRLRFEAWATAGHACNASLLDPSDKHQRYFGRPSSPSSPGAAAAHACAGEAWWSEERGPVCLVEACGAGVGGVVLYAIDTRLEERMGLGNRWPHSHAPLPPGQALLAQPLARALNLSRGHLLVVRLSLGGLLRPVSLRAPQEEDGGDEEVVVKGSGTVLVGLEVAGVFAEGGGGKFGAAEAEGAVVVEYGSVLQVLAQAMVPGAEKTAAALRARDPYALAHSIVFNLPPPRVAKYLTHSYSKVQGEVLRLVERVAAVLGYDDVEVSLGLLEGLREMRFVSMLMSLVLSLVLCVLSVLLVLLLYSLLVVAVDRRLFALAIARLVGMTRRGVAALLVVQTLVLSVPAWALGLCVAHVVANALLEQLSVITKTDIDVRLQPRALASASVMGLLLPLVAAILPIRKALASSLHDTLDRKRNPVPAVAVNIVRASPEDVGVPFVGGASVLVLVGAMVYYWLPLALVAMDLTLLLNIFLALLLGMLAGLTILLLNLDLPLQHLLVRLSFLCVSPAMRALAHQNLIAHRPRNRKTTLVYALSLAFVLFVVVTLSLQVKVLEMQQVQAMGGSLRLLCPPVRPAKAFFEDLDSLVSEHALILDAAHVSHSLRKLSGYGNYLKTLARLYPHANDVYALSPNALTVIDSRFLTARQQKKSATSLSEDLYTPRGSQSAIIGSLYHYTMGISLDSSMLLELRPYPNSAFARIRPLAFLDNVGLFVQSRHPRRAWRQDALVSFPTFARLLSRAKGLKIRMSDIPIRYVIFQLQPDLSDAQVDEVAMEIKQRNSFQICELEDVRHRTRQFSSAQQAMNLFEGAMTAAALIVCFFSLCSSMLANIHEQSKEIGMLRALGVTVSWIASLYSLEAVVLVLSAGVLGIGIGTFIAYTINAQSVLFTQLQLPFEFPTAAMGWICLASLISSLLAAYLPAKRLMRRNTIVTLLQNP